MSNLSFRLLKWYVTKDMITHKLLSRLLFVTRNSLIRPSTNLIVLILKSSARLKILMKRAQMRLRINVMMAHA